MTGPRGVWRVLREAALWFGAVLGLACLVVTIAGVGFGVKALVFRSGSMSPTISTGALAFAHPVDAADLHVGDVVSVTVNGQRVTHRIAHLVPDGDRATVILKGDVNRSDDTDAHVVRSADRVFFEVPRLGYAVGWLGSPWGLFALGLSASGLLVVIFKPGPRAPGKRRHGSHAAPAGVVLLVIALAPASLSLNRVVPTGAWFTDSASATTESLFAYTVPAPVLTCTPSLLSAKVSWTAVSTPYAFTYTAVNASTGAPFTIKSTGSTRTVTVSGLLVGTGIVVRVDAVLPGGAAWTASSTQTVNSLAGLGLGYSCG